MSYISYMSMYLLTSSKSTLRCQTFYCPGELYLKPFSQCMTKKKNNKYNDFFSFWAKIINLLKIHKLQLKSYTKGLSNIN